jgi:4'-phosphopantetheinyl transferase
MQGGLDPSPLPAALGNTVRLWQASLDVTDWRALLSHLSAEEQGRAQRFAFERDARRYVASHAALRSVLGTLLGLRPDDVALGAEAGGKPVLADGGGMVQFSLSHAEELALIGVAARPLGVDLEWLAAPLDVEALARSVFSPRERAVFAQVAPAMRREVFLRVWTQKEAILKATGRGLAILPPEVEVLLAPDDALGCQAAVPCCGSRWQVETMLPAPGYVGAVAQAASVGAAKAAESTPES